MTSGPIPTLCFQLLIELALFGWFINYSIIIFLSKYSIKDCRMPKKIKETTNLSHLQIDCNGIFQYYTLKHQKLNNLLLIQFKQTMNYALACWQGCHWTNNSWWLIFNKMDIIYLARFTYIWNLYKSKRKKSTIKFT